MTPALRDRLSTTQLTWLNDHLDMWYVENCCVWFDCNTSGYPWIYIVKPLNIAGFPIEYWQLTPQGIIQPTTLNPGDGYRGSSTSQSAQMYLGTYSYLGSRFFIYSDTEANQVDSVDTIGIPGVGPGGEDSEAYNYNYDASELITLRSLNFNIFDKLKDYLEWVTTPNALNSVYIGERSGSKYASEIILSKLNANKELTESAVDNLALIAVARYGGIWNKLFETLNFDYDPFENFYKYEKYSNSDTDTQTPTNWKTTDTATAQDNIETENESVYGFNSSSPVDSNEREKTFSRKNTSEQTGSFAVTHAYGKEIETRGNIGAKVQEILQDERNIRGWDFIEKVFNDLDELLTKNFEGGLN